MVTGLLSAIGLFIATNIDDIIVLSLFLPAGRAKGTTLRILAGQYLGFMGILAAAVLVMLGAGVFLPAEAIPYFGLIPWPWDYGRPGRLGEAMMTTMMMRRSPGKRWVC